MNKIDKNKQKKRKSLFDAAFRLFTSKGIQKTSISDIVDHAGIAGDTFGRAGGFVRQEKGADGEPDVRYHIVAHHGVFRQYAVFGDRVCL